MSSELAHPPPNTRLPHAREPVLTRDRCTRFCVHLVLFSRLSFNSASARVAFCLLTSLLPALSLSNPAQTCDRFRTHLSVPSIDPIDPAFPSPFPRCFSLSPLASSRCHKRTNIPILDPVASTVGPSLHHLHPSFSSHYQISFVSSSLFSSRFSVQPLHFVAFSSEYP